MKLKLFEKIMFLITFVCFSSQFSANAQQCSGEYAISINPCGYWDESTFIIKNESGTTVFQANATAGTFTYVADGLGNNVGPFTVFISTIGNYNDNCASWSVAGPEGEILSGQIGGGQTYTSTPFCAGSSATISSVLSGSTTICSGNSANLNIAITGGISPYEVVYSDGTSNFSVASYISEANIPITPTDTTTYSIISVTDASGALGAGNSGTPTITVIPTPTSFTFGGINYEVTAPNTVAVGYSPGANGDVVIPTSVTNACGTYTVASMNYGAFQGNTGLTSITIPDTITSIESDTFKECTSLIAVNISNSITSIGSFAFIGCTQLYSVTIGNAVTSIGFGAFANCYALTSITIPGSVTSIGDIAFYDCVSLTSVTVSWTTPLPINANIFSGVNLASATLNVPTATETTYDATAVWTDFGNITSGCTLTDNITTISTCGSYTWANTGQTYTYSGVYIGTTTNCVVEKLDLTITSTPTIFGFDGIYYEVTSPTTVGVFDGSGASGDVIIPATVNTACDSFSVTGINYAAFQGNTGLTSITIPDTVTNIDTDAFKECTSLIAVNISNSVTNIGSFAFIGCTQLYSVTIGNAVTSIGVGAFANCYALTSLTIPGSVTSIGDIAFYDCFSLTSVSVSWPTPLPINANVFSGVNLPGATLHVPTATEATYEATAVWTDFGNITSGCTPTDNITTVSACDSYTWNGQIYTTSGVYTGTTTNCVTEKLELTINRTIWDGSSWSNGLPDSNKGVLISGDYAEAADLTACSLEVSGNAIVTIPSGFDFTISGKVTVAPTASLTVENDANLIQLDNVENAGNIKVKRDATMRRLDYVFWGTPVTGQDLKLFSPKTISPPVGNSRFYTLDEPSNSFSAIVEPSGVNFIAPKGYMLRAPNNFPTNGSLATFSGVFAGVPNNGDLSIGITNSGVGKGYNMLGNPYPSAINADLFLAQNPGELYFWTHFSQDAASGANYATYTTFGTAAAAGGIAPDGTIAVGQGFIFRKTVAGLGTAVFTNAMRTENNTATFFRNVHAEKHRIWLNLSNAVGIQNQILVGYMDGATNEIDVSVDAKQIEGGISNIASLIGDEKFNIQARTLPFSIADEVHLSFNALTSGDYTIAIDHIDGLFADGQDIFLKDALTGTVHDVKTSAYEFASEQGTFANRFSIVYQNTTLGTGIPTINPESIILFEENGIININSGNAIMKAIKVFDARGRFVYATDGINTSAFSLTELHTEREVLLVQVTLNDGQLVTKKAIN
ncbi:leucine-rich repeat protein [Flavobacterium sp. BFFFF1]|uniref:leucine-rich repeat protein n=1 Tax=Flavobacterium sp. BFFFF1 TaxID=2015557 RepID=UPI0025BE06FF|nr:leucine-rich repeat protein [Flavobacterium sp. BFFFF1]